MHPQVKYELEDYLLNKVPDSHWYYYQMNLNEIFKSSLEKNESPSFKSFLDQKVNRLSSNSFRNEENIQNTLLPTFITEIKKNPNLIMDLIKRIFKKNEILNKTKDNQGFLGFLNRYARKRRNRKFNKKVKRDFRSNKENITILAEGDSWFEYPLFFVQDVISWLVKEKRFAVKSLASGGDWLSNIMMKNEYIEDLPIVSPDVLLISGGGNDMVGSSRLSTMILNPKLEELNDLKEAPWKELLNLRKNDENIDVEKYKLGLQYLSFDYFNFINIIFLMYFSFIIPLAMSKKYKKMLIITQGYDFAIPRMHRQFKTNWLVRQLHKVTGIGEHMYYPLIKKAIVKREIQEAIVYTMIYEFNEMLIQFADFKFTNNIKHIDNRGLAKRNDWYDELHLKSKMYKIISNTYIQCINDYLKNDRRGELLPNVYHSNGNSRNGLSPKNNNKLSDENILDLVVNH